MEPQPWQETPESPIPEEPEAPPPNKQNEILAIVSFVCGGLGLVGWCLPFCGCPVALAGLATGALGIKSKHKIFAIIGIALSVVSLGLTLINSAVGVYLRTKGRF